VVIIFDVEIFIENGDEYGKHDLLIVKCKMPVVPRKGEFIRIINEGIFLVQKVEYSILPDENKTFIRIYVYKIII